jgi:acetate kinase
VTDAIVVINAGSSSIKFSAFEVAGADLAPLLRGQAEGLYTTPRFIAVDAQGEVLEQHAWAKGVRLGHDGALDRLLAFLQASGPGRRLAAVGHRVVHGGLDYSRPTLVDAATLARLERHVPLAPLHQPHNLTPIRILMERAPGLPQVACFDTAFHSNKPELARRFALPEALHAAGVQRYGFHGLSYEYLASVLPSVDARAAAGRVVALHLGNGSSMCAMLAGRSMDSTMGFTAVDGLPMGTRCGALDPGVLLYLMDQRGMDARAIERLIYSESGLLGVSGLSSDMRTLLATALPSAQLAIDLYLYRIRRELGALTAVLGGLDALVFTAGIGENSAAIRARICRDAAWLGLELDEAANAAGGPRLTTAASKVAAWVLPTNEELMIARHTQRVLQAAA